jgi:hypothetical protein
MRMFGLMLLAGLMVCSALCIRMRLTALTTSVTAQELRPVSATGEKIDFGTQVEPLLKSKCQPCHFNGGKMYEKLPFDRPQTIRTLGTKLFTRIHDENERKLIRDFLAQN